MTYTISHLRDVNWHYSINRVVPFPEQQALKNEKSFLKINHNGGSS
jgi:hypothetical protein